jgi:hypothetical protein
MVSPCITCRRFELVEVWEESSFLLLCHFLHRAQIRIFFD